MDVNELLYEFKMLNGVGRMLKTSFSDSELAEVIVNISRKTFSHYFKHTLKLEKVMFTNDLRITGNTFKIPEIFLSELAYEDMTISGIKAITKSPTIYGASANYNASGALGLISRYSGTTSNLVATTALRRRLDMNRGPLRHTFRSPDKIEFKVAIVENESFDIEFEVTHPKNLSTITEGYAEAFKKLCFLDLKITLWNNEFKYLDGSNMGDAQLELKLDSFSTAEADKVTLLDDWMEKFVADTPRIVSANY